MRLIITLLIACVVGCERSAPVVVVPRGFMDNLEIHESQPFPRRGDLKKNIPIVAGAVPLAHDDEADRERIRAWLRENLDVPKWEEVKWWPVRVCPETTHLIYDDGRSAYQLNAGDSICRLKFRTTNPFGSQSIRDCVFVRRAGRDWEYDHRCPWTERFGPQPPDPAFEAFKEMADEAANAR